MPHPVVDSATGNRYLRLERSENQARGIAEYARAFIGGDYGDAPHDSIDASVWQRLDLFHVDSIGCGIGALSRRMNAPIVLRNEALDYTDHAGRATCLAGQTPVRAEKAVVANASAVRELDANGTNFGYNPRTGQTAGEFGHNDFYPVAVAGAQLAGADGATTARAMLCLDEIRGRLAEAFSLKDHKIDHVVHGGIASAAVYGALRGATVDQIESAIGQLLAHYIPFRAIRAGKQLSDSKGASAALTAEMAVQSVHRAMRGFVGPRDIFRNPQAIFCLFQPPTAADQSPFDLELATGGSDFAVMGMHFKLGLHEHQSAGAIEAWIGLLQQHPELLESPDAVDRVEITIYQPAFGIIGDPAKRDPQTRQSADHSMVYIIATLWRKALQQKQTSWQALMLMPEDYDDAALHHELTRRLMQRIDFRHGGEAFDRYYPEGIPTQLDVVTCDGSRHSSGMILFPTGHARNESDQLDSLLRHKFRLLVEDAVEDSSSLWKRFERTATKTAGQIASWYTFSCRDLVDSP